jgi:hypothetical protein
METMKKKYVLSYLFLALLGQVLCIHSVDINLPFKTVAPHMIIFFIEPLLDQTMNSNDAIQVPKNISHAYLKQALISNEISLYATYAGSSAHTNKDGEITFPRRHEKNEVTCLITQKIKPIIFPQNTVQNFIVDEKTPAKTIQFTRQQNLKDDLWYWDSKEIPTQRNSAIPLATVIFFAKPAHLYIPLKQSVAMPGPHLLMPTIYATKYFNQVSNALAFLKVSKYFKPINFLRKTSDDRLGEIAY